MRRRLEREWQRPLALPYHRSSSTARADLVAIDVAEVDRVAAGEGVAVLVGAALREVGVLSSLRQLVLLEVVRVVGGELPRSRHEVAAAGVVTITRVADRIHRIVRVGVDAGQL